MKNLEKKLRKGLLWSVLQALMKRVFDLFVKLVLLNILFPEDFGIVSIAAAFSSIIYVIAEFGLKSALVQKKKTELFDIHYQSVFWWSLFWSCIIYCFVYFVGTPTVSEFYNEPLLLKIIPVLAIPIILEAITLIFRVKMLRNLNFKIIAIINTIATVLSGFIALIMAFKGAGLWALVIYIFLPFLFVLPIYILTVDWRPKFLFKLSALTEIFRFSIFTFSTALVLIVSSNIDYLFIGKLISTESLGIYSLAYMLTVLVSNQVTSMIDRVMFPFYSNVQNNIIMVKIHYLKSLQYYSLLLYPVMLGLIVLCSPMIKTFFDTRWIEAKTPIRILALVVLVNLFTHSGTIVYRSIGKPKLEMFISSITLFFVTLPAVYFGSFYGLNGVAFALLISAFANLLISLYFLYKELSITFLDILVKLKPPIIAFIITFIVVFPIYLFTAVHFFFVGIILLMVYALIINHFYKGKFVLMLRKILIQEH